MKVGNEIDHLGTAMLEHDFSKESAGALLTRVAMFVGQLLLVVAMFGVVLLWMIALS